MNEENDLANGCLLVFQCNLKEKSCCKHYLSKKTETGTVTCSYFNIENQQCESECATVETLMMELYSVFYNAKLLINSFKKEYRHNGSSQN